MKRFTFRGGTHLEEHKDTAALSTERLPEPASVSIPLSQHIGAPATPVVKVGDSVKIGQKLGEVAGGLGCPVHASVSGTVRAIVTRRNAMGTPVTNVVIENDGLRTMDDSMKPIAKPLPEATPEEIVEIVREAGISGLGGATFPTYAKIQSAMGKANLVIVNCAECEPYLTANHRLLLERGEIVISGMEIVMRALGVTEGILAVEDNKPDAIRLLEDRLKRREGLERGTNLRVCVLRTKYPQGDERQLVAALLGREIPAGKLPADVGCMILNAARSAGIAALDTVYSDVNNEEGFIAEATLIKKLGFDGKSVINPRQIEPLHHVFMPSEKDLNKARAIMDAIAEANARGSGVASLKGKMIDKPVVTRAKRLLDLYEAGSKIDEVEEI